MNHQYTIIIQGPINPIAISNLAKYSQFGNIIISTWSDKLLSNDLVNYIKQYAKIVVSDLPVIDKSRTINNSNVLFQLLSTHNGLINTTTDFCIKVRSDEKFTNLSELIYKHQNNIDKIICSNIFFRKPAHYLYHISDHIICGKSELLLRSFQTAIKLCYNPNNINILNIFTQIPSSQRLVPEQIICLSILQNLIPGTNKIPWKNKSLCIKLIKKYFDVINVDTLGDITVCYKDFYRPSSIRHSVNSTTYFLDKNKDVYSSMDEYK